MLTPRRPSYSADDPTKGPIAVPKTEEIKVTDVDLAFTSGQTYSVTLYPTDTLVETPETLVITLARGEVVSVNRASLAYTATRPRTIVRPVGPSSPIEPTNHE